MKVQRRAFRENRKARLRLLWMPILREPSEKDFEPAVMPSYGVSVLFKPTQARYLYKVVSGRTERARIGALEPGFSVDRKSTDLGGYDDAEVEKLARRVALALAEKLYRGN